MFSSAIMLRSFFVNAKGSGIDAPIKRINRPKLPGAEAEYISGGRIMTTSILPD